MLATLATLQGILCEDQSVRRSAVDQVRTLVRLIRIVSQLFAALNARFGAEITTWQ
jgi:hypothetical protein